MNMKEAVRELAGGQARPIYVCYGPETYQMNEFIAYATDKLVEPDARELAVSRFNLTDTSLDEVLDDAEMPAFLAPTKVILAKGAWFLTGSKDTSKVEHRTERLLDYLKSPVTSTVLLITVHADKLDERKKVVKQLKEANALVAFPHLTAEELQAWIRKRCEKAGTSLGAGAAEALLQQAGANMQTLAGEIEKLTLFAGQGGQVTVESVLSLVAKSTEQNVFMLVEDIIKRRTDRALETLAELMKQREEPIKIVSLLASQFRLIAMAKELGRVGYSQQQIASQLGVHPYRVKLAAEQGGGYAPDKLKRIIASLAELDYEMKTGQTDKTFGLELLLLKLSAA